MKISKPLIFILLLSKIWNFHLQAKDSPAPVGSPEWKILKAQEFREKYPRHEHREYLAEEAKSSCNVSYYHAAVRSLDGSLDQEREKRAWETCMHNRIHLKKLSKKGTQDSEKFKSSSEEYFDNLLYEYSEKKIMEIIFSDDNNLSDAERLHLVALRASATGDLEILEDMLGFGPAEMNRQSGIFKKSWRFKIIPWRHNYDLTVLQAIRLKAEIPSEFHPYIQQVLELFEKYAEEKEKPKKEMPNENK